MLMTTLGAAMIATSAFGIHRNLPNTHLKILVNRYFDANGIKAVKIRNLLRDGNNFKMELTLPYDITATELQKHVPGIEQVTSAFVRFSYAGGPVCTLEFGFSPFKANMKFIPMISAPLTIPLYTPFGTTLLDFNRETSCHMLVGGSTRMGKTAFLRLVSTMLICSTDGKIAIKMLDNKINDLYMFKGIPQVEIGETQDEALRILLDVVQETEDRKRILKRYDDCVDIREFREKHPEAASEMVPLFVIVDEYGRFADHEDIQKAVESIAETSGYLDIHLIIASQRPDATSVLKPRIKANLTTRVCFTTMDETNSKVVLDLPDAARLRKVQGRAILLDGFPEVVQVPYMSAEVAKNLLKNYVKEDDEYDNTTGCENNTTINALQSYEPKPIGVDSVSEFKKRNNHRKSSSKKVRT